MERQIKGIFIPIEIWENKELSWNEKILLMEIDSLTSKDKPCFFSNAYIAELLGIKEDTASRLVSSLIRKGYIRQTGFDGRKRYLASCIVFQCRLGEKSNADLDKNPMQGRTEIQHTEIRVIDKDNKQDYCGENPTPTTLFDEPSDDGKKKSEKEIIAEKTEKFRVSCEPFIAKYGKPMVDAFVEYWTEPNGKRLKWEVKKAKSGAFDLSRRMSYWSRQDFNKPRYSTQTQVRTTEPTKQRPIWEDMGLTYEQWKNLQ